MKNTHRVLREFPELWAVHHDWMFGPDVKICRAPDIDFLAAPLLPSADMTRVVPFTVTDQPSVEPLQEQYCGKSIIEERTRSIDLQRALLAQLPMFGDHIRCFFLLETGRTSVRSLTRITVVKPPVGHKNFERYYDYLSRKYPSNFPR